MPDGSHRGPVVLPDLRLFERPVFRDTRGTFTELWREDAVREDAGLPPVHDDDPDPVVIWRTFVTHRGYHTGAPLAFLVQAVVRAT